jgi:hypothetical protein
VREEGGSDAEEEIFTRGDCSEVAAGRCSRGSRKAEGEAVKAIGVTETTYHRWRREYGRLKLDQIRRLKELEGENSRLRHAVSDLTLDKMILNEALRGKS